MIELSNVQKSYRMGNTTVHALQGISLAIDEGDFVAILGPSGSGKSTLMHVLGLLDTPDTGSYKLFGREIARLGDDDLARLRRDAVGFVFQQFNLLPRMSAAANVALPLIYSGHGPHLGSVKGLLRQVGLADRASHRPNELSGGQQQRVAIARAMIRAPRILLADEPTGNLDSASKEEILGILRSLNASGITVILVTHEEELGSQANRRIRLRDGLIQSDERLAPIERRGVAPLPPQDKPPSVPSPVIEHFRQGFRSLAGSKIRTALSILGILIGVAAVVAMLALGQGARNAIEKQLSSLGSNMLMVHPGAMRMGGVALQSGVVTRLTLEDVAAVEEEIPGARQASPTVNGRAQITFSDRNWNSMVQGTGPAYASMRAATPVIGRFFTADENRKRTRVALVGKTVVRNLFGDTNPVGEMIKVNKVIFQVIGVLPEKGATGFRDQDDVIVIPVLTAMYRLFGKTYIDSMDIEVSEASEIENVREKTRALLFARHKVPLSQQQDAFQVHNMADIQEALSSSSRIMSLLLALIAAISLLVGGIGIMILEEISYFCVSSRSIYGR